MKFTKILTITSATLAFTTGFSDFSAIGAEFDSAEKIGKIEAKDGVLSLKVSNTEYAEMSKTIAKSVTLGGGIELSNSLDGQTLMEEGKKLYPIVGSSDQIAPADACLELLSSLNITGYGYLLFLDQCKDIAGTGTIKFKNSISFQHMKSFVDRFGKNTARIIQHINGFIVPMIEATADLEEKDQALADKSFAIRSVAAFDAFTTKFEARSAQYPEAKQWLTKLIRSANSENEKYTEDVLEIGDNSVVCGYMENLPADYNQFKIKVRKDLSLLKD